MSKKKKVYLSKEKPPVRTTSTYRSLEKVFTEAGVDDAAKVARITEGLFASGAVGGYDPDANLTAAQGGSLFYRRLTQAARDLNPLIHERAIEIAAWLYDTNPLAKRLLELVRDFVIGEGITVVAAESEVQEVIDDFWFDPYNNFDVKVYNKVLELGLFGELISSIAVNPIDGHVRLATVDPAMIADVITNPKNVEMVTALAIRAQPLQGSSTIESYRLKMISLEEDPNSEWYGRLVSVLTDMDGKVLDTYVQTDASGIAISNPIPYDGSAFYFRANNVSTSKRGRSDLLSLLDWVDAYDQVLFNEVDREILMRSFIWDVTLESADATQMQQFVKDNQAPKPGTIRVHNEKATWQAITPDLQSGDVAEGADLILSHIATGSGFPKTWLNGTMDVNKSASEELSEPAYKHLVARQKFVDAMFRFMIVFALDQAEMHGLLARRKNKKHSLSPEPWKFTINFPDLRASDVNTGATAMKDAALALTMLSKGRILDLGSIQKLAKVFAAQFNIDLDLDEVNKALEEENKDIARLGMIGAIKTTKPTQTGSPTQGSTGTPGKEPGMDAKGTPEVGELAVAPWGQNVTAGVSA